VFGHEEVSYRTKNSSRTEWRPIQKDTQEGNNGEFAVQHIEHQTTNALEDFTQVSKKAAAHQLIQCAD